MERKISLDLKEAQNVDKIKPNNIIHASIGNSKINKNRSENKKKIDLGAAALYAQQLPQQEKQDNLFDLTNNSVQDSTSDLQEQTSTSGNLLTDLFTNLDVNSNDILNGRQNGNSNVQLDNFADFSNFNANENSDDFADFQSAFDTPVPLSNLTNIAPSSFQLNDLNVLQSNSNDNNNSFAAMNPFLSLPTGNQLQPQILTPLTPISSALSKTNTNPSNPSNKIPKIGNIFIIYL